MPRRAEPHWHPTDRWRFRLNIAIKLITPGRYGRPHTFGRITQGINWRGRRYSIAERVDR